MHTPRHPHPLDRGQRGFVSENESRMLVSGSEGVQASHAMLVSLGATPAVAVRASVRYSE
jgi:hypothetical protein